MRLPTSHSCTARHRASYFSYCKDSVNRVKNEINSFIFSSEIRFNLPITVKKAIRNHPDAGAWSLLSLGDGGATSGMIILNAARTSCVTAVTQQWNNRRTAMEQLTHNIVTVDTHCSLTLLVCSLTLLVDYFKPYF